MGSTTRWLPSSRARTRSQPALQSVAITVILGLCGATIACGHRGDPRPPVYPAPPPIARIAVSQAGTDAILRFPLPPQTIEAGNDTIEVSTIEVLVFTERYPVLDLDLLAAALERHRDLIIEDAVAAAEIAAEEERLEAIRAQYEDPEAAQAAVEAAREAAREARAQEGEEPDTVRDADERLIYHIAPSVREVWRNEGVTPDVILDSARNLTDLATTLWTELGLPTTVLDPTMPMSLPDTAELEELAASRLEEIDYEREVPVETFVTRAGAPQRLSFEDAEQAVIGDLVELVHSIGIPSPEQYRTRYFFSVRARTARNVEGEVRTVRSLAPSPVPLSPADVIVELGYELRPIPVPLVLPVLTPGVDETQPPGVNVRWRPPAGDVWGRFINPTSLTYNVYRIKLAEDFDPEAAPEPAPEAAAAMPPEAAGVVPSEEAGAIAQDAPTEERASAPLNPRPLTETSFMDRSMEWGEWYRYEVRAMVEPPLGPGLRESMGARSAAIQTVDTFAPDAPEDLQIVRAGSQVRLQWRPATAPDLLGYRIYRHPLPAPLTIDDTWEELTPEPVGASRFLDSATDSGVRYAYAVVSVDEEGNVSEPLIEEEPGEYEE